MPASLSPLLNQSTDVLAVRGEGSRLFDGEGRSYLDFTSGIGVTSTGHCHPKVVEAVRHQAGQLIHGQVTTVMHPRLLELAERLGAHLPDGIDHIAVSIFVGTQQALDLVISRARFVGTGHPVLRPSESTGRYRFGTVA